MKIERGYYIVAGILTFLVFVSGILIGWYLDNQRVSYLTKRYEDLETELQSLIIEDKFYQIFGNSSLICNFSFDRMYEVVKEVDELGERLESFEKINQFNLQEFGRLKKRYTNLNIDLWLRILKLKGKCNYTVHTILYFYPTKTVCVECDAQGLVLTYWKNRYPKQIMIFPIDGDLDIPLVSSIKSTFNVERYTTLIIDEKKRVEGFISKEDLGEYFKDLE